MQSDIAEMYRRAVTKLERLMYMKARHEQARPDCGAAPMCVGGPQVVTLYQEIDGNPEGALTLILAALSELTDARARLEKQREATAAALVQVEEMQVEMAGAEARVKDLELRCAALQSDLDAVEAASEILRPGLQLGDLPPDV